MTTTKIIAATDNWQNLDISEAMYYIPRLAYQVLELEKQVDELENGTETY